MGPSLYVILDDLSTAFTYGPQNWTVNEQAPWYGGTSTYAGFANATVSGSFNVSFQGTSISFTGNTPAANLSQSIMVSIDGGTPYKTSYMDPTPQSYLQWYQSPTLSEGQHILKVNGVAGTSIDYATITVGQYTPLSGMRIIVDNDDPSVHYFGSWTRNTNEFVPGGIPKGLPFRNSTHRSSTPGDTITFRFSGTSVGVHGIFEWGNIGTLAATYTIDGGVPTTESYPVTTSSPKYVSGALENSNFQFFLINDLSIGDHKLVINVTQCRNHTFIFDYITYSPSFANLASMPSLVSTSSAFRSTSTSTSSSGTASPRASRVPQSTGLIVGGVVVGMLALALAAFLLFWLRRRKIQKDSVLPNGHQKETSADNPNTSSPAILEGQPRWNPTHSRPASFSTTVTPFQDTGSHAPATYLKQHERNVTSSNMTSVAPSTAGSPSDVAGSEDSELMADIPASGPVAGRVAPQGFVRGKEEHPGVPPAYEAIMHNSPSPPP